MEKNKLDKEKLQSRGIKRKDLVSKINRIGFFLDDEFNLTTRNETFVSNTLILPIREKSIDNSTNHTYKVVDFLCIVNGKILEETIECQIELMDKELFNILKRKLGLDFKISNNKKILDEYLYLIKNLDMFVEKVNEYSQIGWIIYKGSYVYLDGKRLITRDDTISKEKCVLSDSLNEKKLGINVTDISEKDAFKFSIEMLDIGPRNITIPLLLFALSSTMNSLLADVGIEARFILWLHGETGTRKTTIAKLFFNFISQNALSVDASFKDTIASIQFKMSQMKDCGTFFDDYHPPTTKNERSSLDEKVSFITRSTSDSSSKSRMNRSMTKQAYLKNEGNVAVTSEDVIKGHSSLARTYPILLNPNSIDLRKLSKAQNNIENYSSFIANFIKWTSIDVPNKIKSLEKYHNKLRKMLYGIKVHGRVIDQVIQMYTMCEVYLLYGLENKYIGTDEADAIRNDTKKALIDHVYNMNMFLSDQKPSVLYLRAVEELLASNQCKLNRKGNSKGKGGNSNTLIGWEDDDKIYLIAGMTYARVLKYWSDHKIEFPKSQSAIHQELQRYDLIKSGKDKGTIDYTLKSTVYEDSKTRVRTLVIYKDKYRLFLEKETESNFIDVEIIKDLPSISTFIDKDTKLKSSSKNKKISRSANMKQIMKEVRENSSFKKYSDDFIIKI